MRYGVLGSLRVEREGVEVLVPGARQQALVGALVLARGRTVSPEALIDAVWGAPPAGASTTLQTYVSRLRTVLGHDAVVLGPGGYPLVTDADDLDLVQFDRLADEGTSALWRAVTGAADWLTRIVERHPVRRRVGCTPSQRPPERRARQPGRRPTAAA